MELGLLKVEWQKVEWSSLDSLVVEMPQVGLQKLPGCSLPDPQPRAASPDYCWPLPGQRSVGKVWP